MVLECISNYPSNDPEYHIYNLNMVLMYYCEYSHYLSSFKILLPQKQHCTKGGSDKLWTSEIENTWLKVSYLIQNHKSLMTFSPILYIDKLRAKDELTLSRKTGK